MPYTGNCEVTGQPCPGGPEECEAPPPQPIDPEICLALKAVEENEDPGHPGGPGAPEKV